MKIITVLLVSGFLLNSCKDAGDGKILLDEKRAAEQVIPIVKAKELQRQFIAGRAELGKLVTDTSFLSKHFDLPNAESFNRDAISLLLNQPGADGIRVYYGRDENGKVRLVLLPVDKNGKDIVNKLTGKPVAVTLPGVSTAKAFDEDGEAVETGQICPPCIIDGQ
ncbi:MAG: hypothetical protein H7Y27_10465 [Gemmatimonadaceae bacterium]|nr:hypothetical protein [Chitinophagaceae bacterium]